MSKKGKYPIAQVGYIDGLMVYLFAIVANLVMQIVISIAAVIVAAATGNKEAANGDYFNLISMILLQAAFLSVPVIYFACKKKAVPELYAPLRKPRAHDALSVLLPVISMVGFFMTAMLVQVWLDKIGYKFPDDVNMNTPGKLVLGILAMVIVAPCIEELIFRGFLLSGLYRRIGNTYAAAALAALAFALMHMSPLQTAYQFFLGFVCGIVAIKSGNLWCAVITHAGSNLIALLAGGLLEKMANAMLGSSVAAAFGTIGLAVAGGALVWLVCFGIEKLNMRNKAKAALSQTDSAAEQSGEQSIGQNAEQDETCGAQVQPKPQAKNEKFVGRAIYAGGIAICLLVWIFMFIAGMI